MEAKGLGSLAKKILLSQFDSAASRIVEGKDIDSEDTDSEDMLDDRDYQPNLDEDDNEYEMDLVPNLAPVGKDLKNKEKDIQAKQADVGKMEQASRNETSSSIKGKKRQLQQTGSMTDFAKTRNRKQFVQHQQTISMAPEFAKTRSMKQLVQQQQQTTQQVPQDVQHQPRVQAEEHTKDTQKTLSCQNSLQRVPTQNNSKAQPERPPQHTKQALERKKMVQGQRLKRQKLQREQCCAPGSMNDYAKLRKRQLKSSFEQLHSVELPLTTLVQDEDHESTLNFTHQHGFEQGSPSCTEASVDNQNEVGLECHVENQYSTPKVAEKKKHRGPTMMVKVHQRTYQERKGVTLNLKGQPIGPPSVVTELASFLGTIAKDPTLAPINIVDWKCMPTKEDIWSNVKEKYQIAEEGKNNVLETVNENWRVYKSRLKRKHYTPYETDEERWKNRPETVPENQFKELLEYWNSDICKEIARINTANH